MHIIIKCDSPCWLMTIKTLQHEGISMKKILYSLVYNIYPMGEHGRPELSSWFNDQCFHCSMGIGTCSPTLRLLVRLLYMITYDLLGLWYHCSPLLWCYFNQLGAFLYFKNNITPCDWMTLVLRDDPFTFEVIDLHNILRNL